MSAWVDFFLSNIKKDILEDKKAHYKWIFNLIKRLTDALMNICCKQWSVYYF